MLIPYKTVYTLIDRHYVRKSLHGYIADCGKTFQDAIKTAKEIEDERFIEYLVEKSFAFDAKYDFFFSYIYEIPTVLKTGVDLTLDGFAKLYVDTKGIHIREFEHVIEAISDRSSLTNEKECMDRFHESVAMYEAQVKLAHDKIQRNEPCPCGSGKKFKNCHGKKGK